MDISADSDLFVLSNFDVNQSFALLEYLLCLLDDHAGILLVQHLSVFLIFHELFNPSFVDFIRRILEPRSVIRPFDHNFVDVNVYLLRLVVKSAPELPQLLLLLHFLVLAPCVLVSWLHLTDLLEVL